MFCNECGHENRNDRKFCSNCGTKLRDYTKKDTNLVMPEDIKKEQEQVKAKNHTSKVCNLVFWALFVLAISLIAPVLFVDKPLKVVFIVASCICFVGSIITYYIKKALLKKIKKA